MDDNNRMMNEILQKKIGNYNLKEDNFVAPAEITVTITLSEYRSLVANDATRKQAIDKANEDKFNRETEIKAVREENTRLKGENYDLKTMIDSLKEQIAELTGKDVADA